MIVRYLCFIFALLFLGQAEPVRAQMVVDVNRADAEELTQLPGIGPKLAEAIIEERVANGPFISPDDLARVPGISSGLIAKISSLVRTGSSDSASVSWEGASVAPAAVREVMNRFAAEPSVREVQNVALEYAKANPERIDSWHARARANAALPQFRTQFDYDINQDLRTRTNLDATDARVITEDDDRSYEFQVRAQWDLDRLIFEPQELAVARESVRLASLRDRVLDEVTRRYFERRRLQIDLELSPPTDLNDRIRKELRLQELSADIDALTGGWFSQKLKSVGRAPY